MNDQYEQLIKALKEKGPVVYNPHELTNRIMDAIPERSKKQIFIIWKAKPARWKTFNILRFVSNTAALFLIGYFVYQQWQINIKIDRLEDKVMTTRMNNELNIKTKYERAIDLLQAEGANLVIDSVRNEMIHINRKSFNQFLLKMQQLEKENETYREKFRQIQDYEM